jgi:hypothetical protein
MTIFLARRLTQTGEELDDEELTDRTVLWKDNTLQSIGDWTPLSQERGTSNDVRLENNGVVELDNPKPDLSLIIEVELLLLDDLEDDHGKGKKKLIDGFTGETGEEVRSSPIERVIYNL